MKQIYLITIRVRPDQGSPEHTDSGGAYVNAFVDRSSQTEAIETAERGLEEAGWLVDEIGEISLVARADYSGDDENLQYFDQALVDGEVLIFHTWPNEPQEGETVQ